MPTSMKREADEAADVNGHRPGKRSKMNLFDDIVIIKVGASETAFRIHKGLLCNASGYFTAASTGSFKEAADGVLILKDEDPVIFSRFNLWLYNVSGFLDVGETSKDLEWATLIGLWIFGEKRVIVELQNDSLDAMIRKHNESSSFSAPSRLMRFVWENTDSNAPLRHFLATLFATKVNLKIYLGNPWYAEYRNEQVVTDISLAQYRYRKIPSTSLNLWDERPKWHIGVQLVD
ncbi:MAG: hypothetical protein Q9166_006289 [cf. Caloplaca sp. 2 TL-2023]